MQYLLVNFFNLRKKIIVNIVYFGKYTVLARSKLVMQNYSNKLKRFQKFSTYMKSLIVLDKILFYCSQSPWFSHLREKEGRGEGWLGALFMQMVLLEVLTENTTIKSTIQGVYNIYCLNHVNAHFLLSYWEQLKRKKI